MKSSLSNSKPVHKGCGGRIVRDEKYAAEFRKHQPKSCLRCDRCGVRLISFSLNDSQNLEGHVVSGPDLDQAKERRGE